MMLLLNYDHYKSELHEPTIAPAVPKKMNAEMASRLRTLHEGRTELDTPAKAPEVPMKNRHWNSFSPTNDEKACLHQT